MELIIAVLSPEEPNYDNAAELGPEALPYLESIIKGNDITLATKATSLVSHIQEEQSVNLLIVAAQSNYEEVRIAAAAGTQNLHLPSVRKALDILKNDQDIGVRKYANKSLEHLNAR